MTDDEIKIAVAEECGWKHDGSVTPTPSGQPVFREWWQSPGAFRAHSVDELPDFPNDLPAMRDAILRRINTPTERVNFIVHLGRIVGWKSDELPFGLVVSTAAQLCEAFLRTFGKWKGE